MDEKKFKILHLRSNEVSGVTLYDVENYAYEGGKPELEDLEYGELAVNYNSKDEMLMIKNDDDEIVAFVNEKKFNESIDSLVKAIISLDFKIDTLKNYGVAEKIDETVMPITSNAEYVTAEAILKLNDKINTLSDMVGKLLNKIDNNDIDHDS